MLPCSQGDQLNEMANTAMLQSIAWCLDNGYDPLAKTSNGSDSGKQLITPDIELKVSALINSRLACSAINDIRSELKPS